MNLAFHDIGYHKFRFIASTVGVALILMVVFTIGGIIRGVILDSATLISATHADLWVVQRRTLGPFVEISRFPEEYYHGIQALRGVAEASPMVMAWWHVERPMMPTPLMKFMYLNAVAGTKSMVKPGWMAIPKDDRFVVIGYKPGDIGGPPALVAGRNIEASHYEIVADVKTGFHIGERVRLGDFTYTVVGLTKNMVGFTADPVIYASLDDAQNMLFEADPWLLHRERRRLKRQLDPIAHTTAAARRLGRRADAIAANDRFLNAVAVKVAPGYSAKAVAREIEQWKQLQVFSAAREVNLQLMGSNRLILLQLSLFRLILVLISGVIIALIIYTFTLDKLKEIAVLKLLGTQSGRLYNMILQQALLMGVAGTLIGAGLELASEPYFPRRVVTTAGDIGQMLVVIALVALLSSLVAVRKAMRVEARTVLGT